jgi:hypothetical protein
MQNFLLYLFYSHFTFPFVISLLSYSGDPLKKHKRLTLYSGDPLISDDNLSYGDLLNCAGGDFFVLPSQLERLVLSSLLNILILVH